MASAGLQPSTFSLVCCSGRLGTVTSPSLRTPLSIQLNAAYSDGLWMVLCDQVTFMVSKSGKFC